MRSRIISGTIAACYLFVAYSEAGAEMMYRIAIFLIFPLACIWYSDAMGGYTGWNYGVRPAITQTTPGCFVAFGGWLALLLPMIFWLLWWMT
jgi:hypothetical protein